jgi:hypothetical protein
VSRKGDIAGWRRQREMNPCICVPEDPKRARMRREMGAKPERKGESNRRESMHPMQGTDKRNKRKCNQRGWDKEHGVRSCADEEERREEEMLNLCQRENTLIMWRCTKSKVGEPRKGLIAAMTHIRNRDRPGSKAKAPKHRAQSSSSRSTQAEK